MSIDTLNQLYSLLPSQTSQILIEDYDTPMTPTSASSPTIESSTTSQTRIPGLETINYTSDTSSNSHTMPKNKTMELNDRPLETSKRQRLDNSGKSDKDINSSKSSSSLQSTSQASSQTILQLQELAAFLSLSISFEFSQSEQDHFCSELILNHHAWEEYHRNSPQQDMERGSEAFYSSLIHNIDTASKGDAFSSKLEAKDAAAASALKYFNTDEGRRKLGEVVLLNLKISLDSAATSFETLQPSISSRPSTSSVSSATTKVATTINTPSFIDFQTESPGFNYVGQLNESCQKKGNCVPKHEEYPGKSLGILPQFYSIATIYSNRGILSTSVGPDRGTKKGARQAVAKMVLDELSNNE